MNKISLYALVIAASGLLGILLIGSALWAGSLPHDPWAERLAAICAVELLAIATIAADIFFIRGYLVTQRPLRNDPIAGLPVAVGMTALDDEESIGGSVRDFLSHPCVSSVVVIDNGSSDRTAEVAKNSGADVVFESRRGYGYACMRALEEAAQRGEILVLVEGDQTFSALDLDKMLAYLEHADMVLGTRTTRELAAPDSQLDFFMDFFNHAMAKLLQLRFWGSRLTDMGCTYRVIRKSAYERIESALHVAGLHFSPHMTIEAFKAGLRILEIPITFRRRVGRSKGVAGRKILGSWIALKMLYLIFFT